jgi:hypothetical protein
MRIAFGVRYAMPWPDWITTAVHDLEEVEAVVAVGDGDVAAAPWDVVPGR